MITVIRAVTKHIMNNTVQKQHVISNYVIVYLKKNRIKNATSTLMVVIVNSYADNSQIT